MQMQFFKSIFKRISWNHCLPIFAVPSLPVYLSTSRLVLLTFLLLGSSIFFQLQPASAEVWQDTEVVEVRRPPAEQYVAEDPEVKKQQQEIIARAEYYLNNLRTMSAQFVQSTQDGMVSDGTFYLSRPGKLRWQYNPPVPVLIVANNGLLSYHDYELEQTSHLPMDDNLGALLTRKNISFVKDLTVKSASWEGEIISVEVFRTGHYEEGQVTLHFHHQPFELKGLTIVDAVGAVTRVTFVEPKFDVKLDKSIFILPTKHLPKPRSKR